MDDRARRHEARTAATAGGAAAQQAVTATSIIGSIEASAAETFAGIFGFVSPILGPAALGPALTGQAQVAAVATGFYAQGSWGATGEPARHGPRRRDALGSGVDG